MTSEDIEVPETVIGVEAPRVGEPPLRHAKT